MLNLPYLFCNYSVNDINIDHYVSKTFVSVENEIILESDPKKSVEIFRDRSDEIGLILLDEKLDNVRGSELIKECLNKLDDVEKKISVLSAGNGTEIEEKPVDNN